MRKIIITITLISFLNLIGCYYQEQMNPTEYKFDEKGELRLTTKDATYFIGGKDYYLENDTLFVTFSKQLDGQTTLKTVAEIPVKDIESVQIEKTNTALTILTALGVIIGSFIVIAILDLASSGSIMN